MPHHVILDASALGIAWQKKSSASGHDSDCVEFAAYADAIAIRHSKAPNSPALLFTRSELEAMLTGAKAGEFDHFTQG